MKKLNLLLLAAILLTGCGSAPQAVVSSWAEAMNAGDMDKALSYLAEDAVVTIIPAMEGDGVYNGHAEIRGWYEPLFAGKGVSTLSGCVVNGETVTCLNTYIDEGLKSMGVDFIESDFVAVVRDGKIQSYTLTITPESMAKFPPPPTPEPIIREVRITSADAIVGKWEGRYESFTLPHEFRSDGLLIVRITGKYVISKGRYWFEDDLLIMNDRDGDCADMPGAYEVYVTYEGDSPVSLRFVLVGEDACASRKITLAGGLYIELPDPTPSAIPLSETRIITAEPIIGTWVGEYDGEPLQMEFVTDYTLVVRWVGVDGPPISVDPFKFEDDLLVMETEGCGTGSYEVYATYEGDKVVMLRFVLVGEDACNERKGTMAGKTFLPAAP